MDLTVGHHEVTGVVPESAPKPHHLLQTPLKYNRSQLSYHGIILPHHCRRIRYRARPIKAA